MLILGIIIWLFIGLFVNHLNDINEEDVGTFVAIVSAILWPIGVFIYFNRD